MRQRLFGNFARLSFAWLMATLTQVATWSTLAGIGLFSLSVTKAQKGQLELLDEPKERPEPRSHATRKKIK